MIWPPQGHTVLSALISSHPWAHQLLGGFEVLLALALIFSNRLRPYGLVLLFAFLFFTLPLIWREMHREFPRPCGCSGQAKISEWQNQTESIRRGLYFGFGRNLVLLLAICSLFALHRENKTNKGNPQ
jgi:hypothetical protein